MATIFFEAQDTLFFRDGRPFNQGEGAIAAIPGRFPPSSHTLVGAVRALWARQLGWTGSGRWEEDICSALGSGKDLGPLSFLGPFLLKEDKPLFPAPALLLGKMPKEDEKSEGKKPPPTDIVRLRPSSLMHCDLGKKVLLPTPEKEDAVEGRKLLTGWWLTRSGLETVLSGSVPNDNDFHHESSLWKPETRTGVQINEESGTAEEGALYTTRHIRLMRDVRLALEVQGRPPKIRCDKQMLRTVLGGESRSAYISLKDENIPLPRLPKLRADGQGVLRYLLIVLTPMSMKEELRPEKTVPGFPGRLVSCCMPRAQRWGGWDTVKQKPLPLRPYIAPGSVLFMEAEEKDRKEIEALHGQGSGDARKWGFGLVVAGSWSCKGE